MKKTTKERRAQATGIENLFGEERLASQLLNIANVGKLAFDSLNQDLGRMLVESIFLLERNSVSGPDHFPNQAGVYKWGHQGGSVFVGDQKLKVTKPRLQGPDGEIPLATYEKLKSRGAFSEELLAKLMAGLSGRRYNEVVTNAAEAFGVSPSSVSRHFVEVSAKKMKEFLERSLVDFQTFAIMLDTVHRGGIAFIVALGIDILGAKKVLGFWEGATENNDIAKALLNDLEDRGLKLSSRCLFIVDGGKGLIKALQDKFGSKLLLQRCVIHKERNIKRHLAKKYRERAGKLFKDALAHVKFEDALKGLQELEKWLKEINISAARSLREAMDEILLIHRLEVPEELRAAIRSTNGIENLFSTTRHREKNLKNYNPEYRGKPAKKSLSRRWLATVLLNAESNFRTVKGFENIKTTIANIEKFQNKNIDTKKMKAA